MKKEKDKTNIDVIMTNGKYYSDGFDDFMSLMSLRSKRFHTLHMPNEFKFSIFEHMSVCGLLVKKYSVFMAKEFNSVGIKKGQFAATYNDPHILSCMYQMVLCHDIEECIIGDIPSPVKIESLEEHKSNVRENLMNFLKISNDNLSVIKVAVKHIDVIAAFIELYSYKNVIDIKQQKNMFDYYVSKIRDYELRYFIKELSEDLWEFYLDIEKNL